MRQSIWGSIIISFLISFFLLLAKVTEIKAQLPLQSDYFKDDPIAQSIIAGSAYTVSDSNLFSSGEIVTRSFEFKLLNAFKQIGYSKITYTTSFEESASTVSLFRFQKLHNLPISNILDDNTMLAIDQEIYQKEKTDYAIAYDYAPTIKYIDAPSNEASKFHLASMYSSFFHALPETMETLEENENRVLSIDEFRLSLSLNGSRFQWLGYMLDPTGQRVLTSDEVTQVVANKGDFRYCADYYYRSYNYDCPTKYDVLPQGLGTDFDYMTHQAHEYGHGVSFRMEGSYQLYYLFGMISFIDNNNTFVRKRPDNDKEFISNYAKSNYFEDFAESFTAYIFEGNIFRELTKRDIYLKEKYDFLKQYVFTGREYQTGDLNNLVRWESLYTTMPDKIELYGTDNPDWIWNYQYPYTDDVTLPHHGDADGDGKVNGMDYVIWLNYYHPKNQQSGGNSIADFNNDQYIDGADYTIWLNNYGK